MEIDQISLNYQVALEVRLRIGLKLLGYKARVLPLNYRTKLVRTIGLEPMTYGM